MGFFSDVWEWTKDKLREIKGDMELAIYDIKSKFRRKEYDSESLEDQIDIDREMETFRKKFNPNIEQIEKACMEKAAALFDDIKDKVRDKFPDLVELIEEEQRESEKKLSGTIMKYAKEHLSKNDEKFMSVLEMEPGHAKDEALDAVFNRVLSKAQKNFNKKLKKQVLNLQEEITTRLEIRMTDEEERMNKRIKELTELEEKAKSGNIDVDVVIDERAPIMEAAQCIIETLEVEI